MIYLVININNDYKQLNKTNTMQKGTIFGIVALIVSVGYIAYSEYPQQIAVATGEQRVFVLAQDLVDAIDQAQYTDGTPVSANPMLSSVIVEDWDNVKALDKANIRTQAALFGFQEIIP